MSIQSYVIEAHPDTSKARIVIVRAYDQDGREYMYSFLANTGSDITAMAISKNAELNESLAQAEVNQVVEL